MAIGLDLDGKKDILGLWVGENESAKYWLTVLNELKTRGIKDILSPVRTLSGFDEAIRAVYPQRQICGIALFIDTKQHLLHQL